MKNDSKLDRDLEAEFSQDVMDLKSKLSNITTKVKKTEKRGVMRLILPILAVAAGLAIAILFLPSLFHGNSMNGVYATYFEPYPMALNQRGDGSPDLNNAITSYSTGNYEQAIKDFKSLYVSSGDNVYLLYVANAEQALENYQTAIDLYDQILVNQDPKVVQQAQWYKALALIKLQQIEKAKELFRSFPPSHYRYEDAQTILN